MTLLRVRKKTTGALAGNKKLNKISTVKQADDID